MYITDLMKDPNRSDLLDPTDPKIQDLEGPSLAPSTVSPQALKPSFPIAPKRAWLFPPELSSYLHSSMSLRTSGKGGDMQSTAPDFVDELQYTRQSEGWEASEISLRDFLKRHGPFDGVLGFSQGSAVAATLCAQQQLQQQLQKERHLSDTSGGCVGPTLTDRGFRFAILSSGFVSACPAHSRILGGIGGAIKMPSLHVFGGGGEGHRLGMKETPGNDGGGGTETTASATTPEVGCASGLRAAADGSSELPSSSSVLGSGGDRQIDPVESERLMALFDAGAGRRVVRHGRGHVLPCSKSVATQVRAFLIDQMRRDDDSLARSDDGGLSGKQLGARAFILDRNAG